MPGDYAHSRICAALAELTGKKDLPYDPQADKQAKRKTIRAWKNWWAKAKESYR